ncbi:hypothetical protein N9998_00370 [Nitrosopumilus sp.]|nr:hypothetical protein [Nitrosopumilus sp.]
MIKETISNSNFWLGLCVAGLAFIMLYPTVEYNFNCPNAAADPDGNETCIKFKSMLWDAVVMLSLGLGGDGSAMSQSMDEKHHRNVVPLMTATIIILFWQKRKG